MGEAAGFWPNALFCPDWVRAQLDDSATDSVLGTYLAHVHDRVLDPCQVFDSAFYRNLYGDEIGSSEPLAYYIREGWRRAHDPNPAFDTFWYLEQHHARTDRDPLSHYQTVGNKQGFEPSPGFDSKFVKRLVKNDNGECSFENALVAYLSLSPETRRPNALFDPTFYRAQFSRPLVQIGDPFWHYRRIGQSMGKHASPAFDGVRYLEQNADVANLGVEPLGHYIMHGAREGRSAHPFFDEVWYIKQPGAESVDLEIALLHFVESGWKQGLDPHPLFDCQWYLDEYKDVRDAGCNPWLHYLEHGYREQRRPNRLFDTAWYLQQNRDVATEGIEPATHYMQFGVVEGRDPNEEFSTYSYLIAHAEHLSATENPLAHYMRKGEAAGLAIFPVRGSDDGFLPPSVISFSPPPSVDFFDSWLAVNPDLPEADRNLNSRLADTDKRLLPKISVIMPCYNSDLALLSEAIESVQSQLYPNWELCICDDASPDLKVKKTITQIAEYDSRVKYLKVQKNQGIAGATNLAVELASGDVLAFLDHDDLLHPHALGELALSYASDREIDIVYTDDDKIDVKGRRYSPQFKPDWSPTLLLSFMYLSHLFSCRRHLFDQVGGVRSAFDGSQDFDLALRMSERAQKVAHIPRILYHWRAVEGSTAVGGDAKPQAIENGRRAVQEAFDRRGIEASVSQPAFAKASQIGVFEPAFPDDGPKVTVVIPTKNRVDLLRVCIDSLSKTTYRNFNILIVDNGSDDPETLEYMQKCGAKVVCVSSPPEGFSFAHVMNAGVKAADGEFVLLLNNDTKVRSGRWLSQMMGYAKMNGVGAVGARLLYDDMKLQHGGITHGLHEGMAGHAFKLLPDWSPGYLQLAGTSREVSGVTAACMLTPKAIYEELGGLDEVNFRVAYNDVDYCYRLVDRGYRCIQCASAELFHFEGKTRGFVDNPAEITAMRRIYHGRKDPFYNPNLSLENEQFEVARYHLPVPRSTSAKVVFVSHNFNHEGAPNSLFELISGLRDTGRVEPIVISPDDGPLRQRYENVGIAVDLVNNPLIGWLPQDQLQANLQRLAQSFLYSGAELVVANTADSFWAVAAAELAGLPSVWIIRESQPWDTYFSHFPRHIANLAYDCFAKAYRVVFVANSTLEAWRPLNTTANFTLNRNGLDSEKLIGSFVGINREAVRAKLEIKPNSCVFTCVGTICDRKGQIDLIRAFELLPDAVCMHADIVLVGDRESDYSTFLHTEIAKLPVLVRNRIHVIPETSKARDYLVGSDVFVCSSRVESYPRVTLEAMAAGLPLITTGVWGIVEQVRADYNALIYEPGQYEKLAAHMVAMVENTAMRTTYAKRAVPVFESLPNFTFMRDRYADLIDQAIGSV